MSKKDNNDRIQGVPRYIISEYSEATEDNCPEHGIQQWLVDEVITLRKRQEELEYAVHLGDEVARKTHNIYREDVKTGETAFDRRLKEFRHFAKYLLNNTRWEEK